MNIPKLRGMMVEKGINVDRLAKILEIDRGTLYRKLNDGEKMTIGQAVKIKNALGMTDAQAKAIFFG